MAKMVIYSGNVQGVGFRATAASVARRHAVSGWVRNRPDGSVELFADGSAEVVEEFLAEVRERMSAYIEAEEVAERVSVEATYGFRIVG